MQRFHVFTVALAVAGCTNGQQAEPGSREPVNHPSPTTSTPQEGTMSIYDAPIHKLDGTATTLAEHRGKALLIVNVASKCGSTPQYEGLEALYEKYAERGLVVLGFPCNQFGAQEPGTAEEIQTFCKVNYGVTFPMYEKIEVNGDGRHPIYAELTTHADASGEAGDIKWNFEKFVVSADGKTVKRFRTKVQPDDAALVAAIEDALPR